MRLAHKTRSQPQYSILIKYNKPYLSQCLQGYMSSVCSLNLDLYIFMNTNNYPMLQSGLDDLQLFSPKPK